MVGSDAKVGDSFRKSNGRLVLAAQADLAQALHLVKLSEYMLSLVREESRTG